MSTSLKSYTSRKAQTGVWRIGYADVSDLPCKSDVVILVSHPLNHNQRVPSSSNHRRPIVAFRGGET